MANQRRARKRSAFELHCCLFAVLAVGLGSGSACQTFSEESSYEQGPAPADGGAFGIGGQPSARGGSGIFSAGAPGFAGAGASPDTAFGFSCQESLPLTSALQAQVVSRSKAFADTFYSWVTNDEAEKLRQTRVLFESTENSRANRGYAFDVLAKARAADSSETEHQAAVTLAKRFGGELFPSVRAAWPNPWANRLGFFGESAGDQPVQVQLKPDAWVLVLDGDAISIRTLTGGVVSLVTANATPERIGAILFLKRRTSETLPCDGPGVGYREFILGNPEMIQTWSLATPEILTRWESDIGVLRELFAATRSCSPYAFGADAWNQLAVCVWQMQEAVPIQGYVLSLGIPGEVYQPTPANLSALLAILEADAFTGAPLVVGVAP